jgi:signal transduction histidine kinase/CheY-like chemotaxis protein
MIPTCALTVAGWRKRLMANRQRRVADVIGTGLPRATRSSQTARMHSPSKPAAPAAVAAVDRPAPPSSSWRVWLAVGAGWLVLALAAAAVLWHLRSQALTAQQRELSLLSQALTDELDRGMRGAEEGLQALQGELREGRLARAGSLATRELRTRADLMPMVKDLWLLDDQGRATAQSGDQRPPALAGFLPRLDHLEGRVIAVGRPFVPAGSNQAMVTLAMHGLDEQGRLSGWVVGTVPAPGLLGAFPAAVPAPDARMYVFRQDGALLASANAPPLRSDEAGIAESLARHPDLEQRHFTDGSDNLVAKHGVGQYGLVVVVSRNLRQVLSGWHGAMQLTLATLGLLLLILLGAVHLVMRAEQRRLQTQRSMDAQQSRASKLQALGTLAGGVAHDFNNVLAGIVGHTEMAQDGTEPGSAQARHLDKVMQAALRGRSLVERILSFSKGGARSASVFALEPLIDEVLALMSGSLRPGIVVERDLAAPGARLRGDSTQAFEALMNLCTNAMQAMPDGGRLSVRLDRWQAGSPQVLSHSRLMPGAYLRLSVSDQGSGISAPVMERLFEPFFTTRGAQSGTGLGLAVVHGVVAELGGAIDVQSAPGHGACFTLYLPECTQDEGGVPAVPRALPPGRGQRVMVVDDEAELVGMSMEMLAALGYAPDGFVDPAAALEVLLERGHSYAAVITDEVMGSLSGTQLTAEVRRHLPDLPVLLVSGYGGALLAQRAAHAGVTRLLAKPLQRAELAEALAQVLR